MHWRCNSSNQTRPTHRLTSQLSINTIHCQTVWFHWKSGVASFDFENHPRMCKNCRPEKSDKIVQGYYLIVLRRQFQHRSKQIQSQTVNLVMLMNIWARWLKITPNAQHIIDRQFQLTKMSEMDYYTLSPRNRSSQDKSIKKTMQKIVDQIQRFPLLQNN